MKFIGWNDITIYENYNGRLNPIVTSKENEKTFDFHTENTERLPIMDVWLPSHLEKPLFKVTVGQTCFF